MRVFRQRTITLAATISPCSPQHSIQQALLRFATRQQYLTTQIMKCVGNLYNMLGGRQLAELALKVFGQNVAFFGAHLTQMHHVDLVGHQGDWNVWLQVRLSLAHEIERVSIRYRIYKQHTVSPLKCLRGSGARQIVGV